MKLYTVNRWQYPESDISCASYVVSAITGKTPTEITSQLFRRRVKKGWSALNAFRSSEWMYDYEIEEFLRPYLKKTRKLRPKNCRLKNLKNLKGAHLVVVTDHALVINDGKVVDVIAHTSPHHHPFKDRIVWSRQKLKK